jgi:hypothetical protein
MVNSSGVGLFFIIFPQFRKLHWGFPTSRNVPYSKFTPTVYVASYLIVTANAEQIYK